MRFPPPPAVPLGRSLFTAAAQLLGLKLEAKGSFEVALIGRMDKPSAHRKDGNGAEWRIFSKK